LFEQRPAVAGALERHSGRARRQLQKIVVGQLHWLLDRAGDVELPGICGEDGSGKMIANVKPVGRGQEAVQRFKRRLQVFRLAHTHDESAVAISGRVCSTRGSARQ
jgi:hypothetical protein